VTRLVIVAFGFFHDITVLNRFDDSARILALNAMARGFWRARSSRIAVGAVEPLPNTWYKCK
jgi:hypothetical protein